MTAQTLADRLRNHVAPSRAEMAAYADEVAALGARVRDYESAITWDTTCLNCSHLLDRCYAETMRAEQAEAKVASSETGKAGVLDAETLAAEPGRSVVEPASRVKHPGTQDPWEAQAQALRDAADAWHSPIVCATCMYVDSWLRDRAARIIREARP